VGGVSRSLLSNPLIGKVNIPAAGVALLGRAGLYCSHPRESLSSTIAKLIGNPIDFAL
jgi:hypothetical protein